MYVGETDGKLHFVDSEGADSVLPFSNVDDTVICYGVKASLGSKSYLPLTVLNNELGEQTSTTNVTIKKSGRYRYVSGGQSYFQLQINGVATTILWSTSEIDLNVGDIISVYNPETYNTNISFTMFYIGE